MKSVYTSKGKRNVLCCIRYSIVDKDISLCLLKTLFSSVLFAFESQIGLRHKS